MPVSATSDDVEDCNWHKFRITWDPATRWLRTFFDNVPRVSAQVDMIGDVFIGHPTVYWGFTGATGGAVNIQEFCTLTVPAFNVNLNNSTCVGDSLLFENQSQTFFPVREYYWDWGDGTASREKDPLPKVYTTPGVYTVKMSMTDVTGCVSIEDVREISVGEKPNALFEVKDVCFGDQPIVSAATNLYSRNVWLLNGNQVSADGVPDLQSIAPGDYKLKYMVTSNVGCGSDELETTFSVQKAIANAGRDSFVIANLPFQLNGFANGFIKWSPSAGLSDDNTPNPVAVINSPQQYYLEVTTTAGCTARDTVNFTVFKEAAIYVPNAFSPNGDGRNDNFRPAYIGIKKLHYFSVYDRWGGQVFTTNNFGQGWNGVHKNSKAAIGTYVWIVSAENIDGKKIQMKGTVTLVR
jgi:gliding motility-associated-like protein